MLVVVDVSSYFIITAHPFGWNLVCPRVSITHVFRTCARLARVRNLRRSLIMRMYTLLSNIYIYIYIHVHIHGSVVRSSNSTLDTTGDEVRIRLSCLNPGELAWIDSIVLEKFMDSRIPNRSWFYIVNNRSKMTAGYWILLQSLDITLSRWTRVTSEYSCFIRKECYM